MKTIAYETVTTPCGAEYRYALEGERLTDSMDVRRDYTNAIIRGYYFSPDTLAWFGSEGFITVEPGVSVEQQTNAPGEQFRVMAWTGPSRDGEGPQPWFGCWHATRAAAVECAREYRATLAAQGRV